MTPNCRFTIGENSDYKAYKINIRLVNMFISNFSKVSHNVRGFEFGVLKMILLFTDGNSERQFPFSWFSIQSTSPEVLSLYQS